MHSEMVYQNKRISTNLLSKPFMAAVVCITFGAFFNRLRLRKIFHNL